MNQQEIIDQAEWGARHGILTEAELFRVSEDAVMDRPTVWTLTAPGQEVEHV
jgi:hypothetical protein